MLAEARKYVIVVSFTFLFLAFTGDPVFSYYTLDARDDAGLTLNQPAYAQFVGANGYTYPIDPTVFSTPMAKEDVFEMARAMGIGWTAVEAEGNIWSTDTIVGDTYLFPAGTYRIAAVGGGFLYDSFGWSNVQNEPLQWYMNIRAQVDGGAYTDTSLGTFLAKDVGTVPLYTDVTLTGPGSLGFWIPDRNSIDNSGTLTFSITSVPEPSTFPFLAGVFSLLLVPGVRRYLAR